ncbi:unnamed protein product [Trichogramma brassicae]|uniref:Uncharacterized protein n=1 Tax=Trichogramma brassicae TaxID=86971 RepID=A0A6H5IQM7_9HYME|nr:unnamed protein product [Trichogramma brassicae]
MARNRENCVVHSNNSCVHNSMYSRGRVSRVYYMRYIVCDTRSIFHSRLFFERGTAARDAASRSVTYERSNRNKKAKLHNEIKMARRLVRASAMEKNIDMDQLLLVCVKQGDAEKATPGREFILFVAATGYRHVLEPEDDGSPRRPYTTAIHRVARLIGTRRYSAQTIEALFRIYGNFDDIYEDESGLEHFHAACMLGCVFAVTEYLRRDGLKEVAVKLLRLGADPNMPNVYGATALHYICNSRQQERDVVEFLKIFLRICDEIGHTLLIDAQTDKQETPLTFAVNYLLLEPIDLLLTRGADASKLVFPKFLLSREDIDFDRKHHHTESLRKASLALTVLARLQENGYEQSIECAQTIIAFFDDNSLFEDYNKPKVDPLCDGEMNSNESRYDEQRDISGESVDDEEDDDNDDHREYDEKRDIYEEDIDILIKNENFIDETQQIKFASSKPLNDYDKQVANVMQDVIEEEEAKEHMQEESRLMCRKQKSEDDTENNMWSLYDVLCMPAGKVERLFTYQDFLEFARSDKLIFMDEQEKKACVKRLTEKMARGYFKDLAQDVFTDVTPLTQDCCEVHPSRMYRALTFTSQTGVESTPRFFTFFFKYPNRQKLNLLLNVFILNISISNLHGL